MKLTLKIILWILICGPAWAADYTRMIDFEWDEIPGATSYELEIKSGPDNIQNFKVKSAQWQGNLTPGKYSMRLRSLDHRKVPGTWSPESELLVGLELPKVIGPQEQIEAKDTEENIKFAWSKVPMAKTYKVVIKSDDGNINMTENTESSDFSTKLPTAKTYVWTVQAVLDTDVTSEPTNAQKLTLLGPPLPTPTITRPISEYVRDIQWSASGDVYIITLRRWVADQKKWKNVKRFKSQKTSFAFGKDWPGGKYQIVVKSETPLRPTSSQAEMEFQVKTGDRSPAAEQMVLIKRAITRTSHWFMTSGLAVNSLVYTSQSNMLNSRSNYDVNGALTKVSLGYETPWSKWGFNTHYEMASYILDDLKNFHTLEIAGQYRAYTGPRSDIRLHFGTYYRETPESFWSLESNELTDTQSTRLGLHLGADYRYSFSYRWGVQTGFHIYQQVSTLDSPFGGGIDSPMSTELGLWGIYRVSDRLSTSIGFSTREEIFKYPTPPPVSGTNSPSGVDQSILNNTSFGLSADWSF